MYPPARTPDPAQPRPASLLRRAVVALCIGSSIVPPGLAPAYANDPPGQSGAIQVAPQTVQPRTSSEYFSSDPDAKVLIRVNVWGEVREPGVHYVPFGSSLADSISSAGGPLLETASLPDITIIRGKDTKEIDLYKLGLNYKLQRNDTIVVESSPTRKLPLIFGGLSLLVSIATLYLVAIRK